MTIKLSFVATVFSVSLASGSAVSAAATEAAPAPIPAGATRVLAGAQSNGFSGGSIPAPTDFISEEQREAMRKEVEANVQRLRLAGRLPALAPNVHPLYGWPLRLAAGLPDPEYHAISNFVDLDPNFPSLLLDFNCGARTYDTPSGYNHSGTDFYTWPWWWRKMDRNEVEAVAAAPGIIIYRNDGNFDRSCGFNNNDWNTVFVQHADGSTAWYGHLKNGSITSKQVGDPVVAGEFLGVVGSSGNSTGPHLHFETYDSLGHLIEPWAGVCNTLNPDSWWASQRPYRDSGVNRITTGDLPPGFPACSDPETPNMRATFPVGALIYFTAYYRDQLTTQQSLYTIYRPDGTVWSQWTHSPSSSFDSSYWFWSFTLTAGEPQGIWKFTVQFEGNTYERLFMLGSTGACASVPEKPGQGEPLIIAKNSSLIRLTWGASCNPPDTDYVVYDGAIGSYYSHSRIVCSTGGNRIANLAPAAGSRYYLVGPRNATREGSLGRASSGVERPVGAINCFARAIIDCP